MTTTQAPPRPADAPDDQMQLLGSTGRPLSGSAAVSARRAAEERAAQEEERESFRAVARYVVAKDGLPAIAAKVGRDDARRIAEVAGGSDRLLATWRDEEIRAERARQQDAIRHRAAFERDPMHDPRVIKAVRQNVSEAEMSALILSIRQEHEAAALAAPPVRSEPVRPPLQTTVVSRDWTEWPDHQPGYAAGFMPGPARAAEARLTPPGRPEQQPEQASGGPDCAHQNPQGAKYCGTCGLPLVPQVQPRAVSMPPPRAATPTDPRSA